MSIPTQNNGFKPLWKTEGEHVNVTVLNFSCYWCFDVNYNILLNDWLENFRIFRFKNELFVTEVAEKCSGNEPHANAGSHWLLWPRWGRRKPCPLVFDEGISDFTYKLFFAVSDFLNSQHISPFWKTLIHCLSPAKQILSPLFTF